MAAADLLGYGPDPARARALDQLVRAGLADSLGELAAAIGPQLGLPPAWSALAGRVTSAPVPPALFGAYSDLVEASLRDDGPAARTAAGCVLAAADRPVGSLCTVTLDDDLGPGEAARYRRLANDDPDTVLPLAAVDAAEYARATALVTQAVALLDRAAPAIADELRMLVREVVLVDSSTPPGDLDALVFDGASTFYLWGAVFLNAPRQRDRVGMALALVHEAAHGLLFGMTLGAPLVEDDPDERHSSPLRADPRPMDGIVHATYVLARMADLLERLLGSDALSSAEREAAAHRLADVGRDYQAGLAVARNGRFTPTGRAAFDAMLEARRLATA